MPVLSDANHLARREPSACGFSLAMTVIFRVSAGVVLAGGAFLALAGSALAGMASGWAGTGAGVMTGASAGVACWAGCVVWVGAFFAAACLVIVSLQNCAIAEHNLRVPIFCQPPTSF